MIREPNEHESEHVQVPCASCGAQNRVPRRRLRDDPTCGRCKQKVFPRKPVTATAENFRAEVEDSPIPVLVDFWAGWCAPCKAVAPALEAIAAERGGKLKVVKVDVDAQPQLAARFGVQSIPTLMLRRGPLVLDTQAGALPRAQLDAWIDRFI